MKKIVPFNNVLTFDTDVCEITAISLEHDIKKEVDAITGTFYITGEYKITDGGLEKEKFSFDLPFDIALGCNYDLATLIVDIDDFRYELLGENKLKVNIDLYIDGEIIEPIAEETKTTDEFFTTEEKREMMEDVVEEPTNTPINDDLTLLGDMLKNKKDDNMETKSNEIAIENNNINIFNGFNEEEKYVTYHVYPVTENDTLEKIMEKYGVSKEELAQYNNIEEIHPGDKLIIPANHNDK